MNLNFFNTAYSIIVGIKINRVGNLGEKLFPKMSGNASIANSIEKRSSIVIKKHVAYRFIEVWDSIFFHQ